MDDSGSNEGIRATAGPPAPRRAWWRDLVWTGLVLATGCRALRLPEPPAEPDAVGPVSSPAPAGDTAVPAGAVLPDADGSGTLRLHVHDAIVLALGHNPGFRMQRLEPAVKRTIEEVERAAFDPEILAEAGASVDRRDEVTAARTRLALRRFLPSGTSVEAGIEGAYRGSDALHSKELSADILVTQALLQGRGPAVNLVDLRQAQLDTRRSQYELRGAALALVADVENAYWNAVLAREEVRIYERSLEVANQAINEMRERIRLGNVAEVELASAEAEVAQKLEELINARGTLAIRRLELIRLLCASTGTLWERELDLPEGPVIAPVDLDAAPSHVALALRIRPDLNEARVLISRGELEVVRTRNGLLPKLDAFVRLGGTAYADAFRRGDHESDQRPVVEAGVSLVQPLGQRADTARHRRAELALEQEREALNSLGNLVQLDVRSAYVAVNTAREQITATAATRALREQSLATEQEKFRVGKSTSLLVAQAWRDLIESQIAEMRATVRYRQALTRLYRLDGSLLERRGIAAPGAEGP